MDVKTLPNGKAHPFAEYPDKPVRTSCWQCGVKMAAHLKTESGYPARSTSLAIIDRAGYFDTLRCAAAFGVTHAEERVRFAPGMR